MGGFPGEARFVLAELQHIGAIFGHLAVRAGRSILEVYGETVNVRNKPDMSPVSDADVRAEAVILDGFANSGLGMPVVSEEAVARGEAPKVSQNFILVDPLDGTREFLARNGEFTVNIALVADRVPVLGVVYAPATGTLWLGASGSDGKHAAIKKVLDPANPSLVVADQPLAARAMQDLKARALASRSHLDEQTAAYLKRIGVERCERIGSSVKFCMLAEGEADVYARYATTMEWDTAAGDAVLRAAGGMVFSQARQPLLYGKPEFRNEPFLACASIPGCSPLLEAFV